MPPKSKKPVTSQGLEASLWEAADRLRSNMDAAEYKHVVLGLIFLKYVSDVFARRQAQLAALVEDPDSDYFMPTEAARQAILESRDEYTAEGVFWVPEGHRWDDLRKAAKQADIGTRIHVTNLPLDAFAAVNRFWVEGVSDRFGITGWQRTFNVSPAAAVTDVWVLGTTADDELGTDTRLGL